MKKEQNGNGKKDYPGKLAESEILKVPVTDTCKIDELSYYIITNIFVILDITEFTPTYTEDDAWWYYDKESNIVHVMISNDMWSELLHSVKEQNKEEYLNTAKVIWFFIDERARTAAQRAMDRYAKYLRENTEASAITEAIPAHTKNAPKPKKEYRTKKYAGNTIDNLPTSLAIITNDHYKGGLGLSQTGEAYLYPLASTDGLRYDGKNLYFKGLPTSEATLKEINKDKSVSIDYIDLPLLRLFYSIILTDFEANSRQFGVVNETVTVYVPDLATAFGKGRDISKNDIKSIIDKTSSFQTIYGILKDPERPNGIGTAVPLLVWLGYDETTNSIKFASPYMTELIKRIYNVSIRKDKKGVPKLCNDGSPKLKVSHSYLVKSSIVKERNKRAAEIIVVVVTTIEQAGKKKIPHLKASTIVKRVPQLQNAIDKAKSTSDKNRILKRAFVKAWELLDTQTKLKEKYPTISLPDPKNPKNIPTMTTLDTLVFEFPHPEPELPNNENKSI